MEGFRDYLLRNSDPQAQRDNMPLPIEIPGERMPPPGKTYFGPAYRMKPHLNPGQSPPEGPVPPQPMWPYDPSMEIGNEMSFQTRKPRQIEQFDPAFLDYLINGPARQGEVR